MPRISAAHEQEVRDRIVAAAVRVFSDKGFHSSTIADVCRESGLSVGAIYTYFPSKEALFRHELRPDRRARSRRAGRAAGRCDRHGGANDDRDRPLHRDDRRVRGRSGPDLPGPGLGRGRPGAQCPRDAGGPTRAAGRGRADAALPGDRGRRAAGVARRRRRHPRVPRDARRAAPPAHRGRGGLPTGRPAASRHRDARPGPGRSRRHRARRAPRPPAEAATTA